MPRAPLSTSRPPWADVSAEAAASEGRSRTAQHAGLPCASGIGRGAAVERDDRKNGSRSDRPSSVCSFDPTAASPHSGPVSTSRWVSMGAPNSSSARIRPRPHRTMATPSTSSSGSFRTGPSRRDCGSCAAAPEYGSDRRRACSPPTRPIRDGYSSWARAPGSRPCCRSSGHTSGTPPPAGPRPARSSCTAPHLRPTSPGGRVSPGWRSAGQNLVRPGRVQRPRQCRPTRPAGYLPSSQVSCPSSLRAQRRSRRDARLRIWQSVTRRGRQARPVQVGYADRCHPHGDVVVATRRRAHLEPQLDRPGQRPRWPPAPIAD